MAAVSFLSACDMRRACSPGSESPMSPSSSARGTRAATESITMTSTALDRTRVSAISSACSPVSGWEIRSSSVLTPRFFAYPASSACSASMNAAVPPSCCDSAMTWSASVVLPDDSGPKISVTRPRGMPPMPSAASSESAPVGMTAISSRAPCPSFMMAPLPNWRSIEAMASSRAWRRSLFTSAIGLSSTACGKIRGISRKPAI